MNTPRVFLTAVAICLIFLVPVPRASALDISESVIGDIPTNISGSYTLTAGTNTFSGSVRSSPPDQRDAFAVTIPSGFQLRSVTKNVTGDAAPTGMTVSFNSVVLSGTGSAAFSIPTPLPAATYDTIVTVSSSSGSNWTIVFTVEAVPDYSVSTTGNQIFVTDLSGGSETLDISQPVAGQIRLAATGRTFSVNNAVPISGNSGNISLSGITDIFINPGTGSDTINVGAIPTSGFPSLAINAAGANDTVNLNGDIIFANGRNLSVTSQTLVVAANANLITAGTGAVSVTCGRNVSLGSGSSLETVNGNLSVLANHQGAATTGNFTGIELAGATLRSSGSGTVTVNGRGGNDAGGFQLGVNLFSVAKITGGTSAVNVTGTGGASTNWINRGVTVYDSGSAITSTGGNVTVTGNGGPQSSSYGIGVSVLNGAQIGAGGTGSVTVTGNAAGLISGGNHRGVEIAGSGSRIDSSGGSVGITGVAGPGDSMAVLLGSAAGISTPSGGGNILIEADSLLIDADTYISSAAAGSSVRLQTSTSVTRLNLGGVDDNTGPPKVLGLTDAELDRISTPNLVLSSFTNANLVISAPISPAGVGSMTLNASTTNGFIQPTTSGIDITLASAGVVTIDGPLACPITGIAPDSGIPQLKIAGGVNLNGRALNLTGTTFAGAIGNSFTVVDNDGSDPINGSFLGMPEGGTLLWPASTNLHARISYVGGDGNDAVLTLADSFIVTTTSASSTNPGSLRGALIAAAATPGADTITFAPALSGQSIVLASEIVAGDADGVTIDQTGLSGGFVFSGNNTCRIFSVPVGGNLTLRGFGFILGNASGDTGAGSGGAIFNRGTLHLTGCTFYNNSAFVLGGAITNDGTLAMTRCTLTGNIGSFGGGALYNSGTLSLTHCTISGNGTGSSGQGGGLYSFGACSLAHSIIAGNSAGSGADVFSGNLLDRVGANLIQAYAGGGATSGPAPISAPALLTILGGYGGPTTTMALLPGSPARNAATGSTSTSDQRGFAIVGLPDLGAYEAGTFPNYTLWSTETFGASPLFGADNDQDGAINGLEYATRRNPLLGDTPLAPVLTTISGARTFSFRYVAAARDLRYIVQRSTDISNASGWQEIYRYDTSTQTITETGITADENPATQVITLNDPATAPKLFWRLRIERLP